MDNKLPMKMKNGILQKLKNWLKSLLKKEPVISDSVEEIKKEDKELLKKDSFKESLEVESKDIILFLQRQLEEKKITISDLTDEQKYEMIELYEMKIEELKNSIESKIKILEKYKKEN